MHLDHGDQPATCLSAIQNGFTSVMMDGSLSEDGKTPADYDYNVAVTAKVAELAHASASRSRASWAASARSRAARGRRRTATAPRACCRATSC